MSIQQTIEHIKKSTKMRFEYFEVFGNTVLACFRDERSANKFKNMLVKTNQFHRIDVHPTLIDGDTTKAWVAGGIVK